MRKRYLTLLVLAVLGATLLVLPVTMTNDAGLPPRIVMPAPSEHVVSPERTTVAEVSVTGPASTPRTAPRPAAQARPSSVPPTPAVRPAPATAAPRHDPLGIPTMSKVAASGNYDLYESDGYMLVNLRGGEPGLFPFGGPSTDKERAVRGRVTDRSGRPVAGAIVFADRGVSIRLDTIMALAATITDGNGELTLTDAPADECFVIALAGADWSALVPCRDGDVELPLRGHGSLAAHITYAGDPETFDIHLGTRDRRFGSSYVTDTHGRLTVPSLPPGEYVATVGLAQSFGGGQSKTVVRQIVIVDGKTVDLALDLARGTTVVVQATPPEGMVPEALTYWLFAGDAPKDGAEARARDRREDAPSMTVGGGAALDPVQLHDIGPGTYWACAAFFDPSAMAALPRPFGCEQVGVAAGDSVREVNVRLAE